jgi:hypothetical protein
MAAHASDLALAAATIVIFVTAALLLIINFRSGSNP